MLGVRPGCVQHLRAMTARAMRGRSAAAAAADDDDDDEDDEELESFNGDASGCGDDASGT